MAEDAKTMELAFGRIWRMLSRPERQGDIAEYERCRSLFLDAAEREGFDSTVQGIGIHTPGFNYGGMVE